MRAGSLVAGVATVRVGWNVPSNAPEISVEGTAVEGSVAKRSVTGTVQGGGPLVRLTSRSGSIRISAAADATPPNSQAPERCLEHAGHASPR